MPPGKLHEVNSFDSCVGYHVEDEMLKNFIKYTWAYSRFSGRSFKPLICKDITFESVYYRLNKINDL